MSVGGEASSAGGPTGGVGALQGVEVLELSQFIAGPVCGCILADHGANVVKIERPGGEDARRIGPFVDGESLYYATYNRNKSAVSLDLKSAEGRELFLGLAAEADIVVENYRPGVLSKLRIGYEELSALNPRLIMVSLSGFGRTGPSSERPAFDQIVQALSGVMYLGGEETDGPQKLGISISDYAAGLQGAIGALLGLVARGASGVGQHVDVALFDSLLFMLETSIATFHSTGEQPARVGNGRPGSVPGSTFECSDGWVYIAATSDRIWERLLVSMGRPDADGLQGMSSNRDRVLNRDQIHRVIARWCADRSSADVVELLESAGVPTAPVRRVDQLLDDPGVAARRAIELMEHPVLGQHVVPGVPVKMSATPGGIRQRAALVGEHNEEVLARVLGLGAERLAELRDRGVI